MSGVCVWRRPSRFACVCWKMDDWASVVGHRYSAEINRAFHFSKWHSQGEATWAMCNMKLDVVPRSLWSLEEPVVRAKTHARPEEARVCKTLEKIFNLGSLFETLMQTTQCKCMQVAGLIEVRLSQVGPGVSAVLMPIVCPFRNAKCDGRDVFLSRRLVARLVGLLEACMINLSNLLFLPCICASNNTVVFRVI